MIAGQQFQIKNSSDCCIYVYDWANTVTIDDCKNCKIFIGAVKTSVFMRDCNNCVLVASCGQLRLRDCVKVDMFLCVNSQPIIEASSGVVVGCLQYSYHALPAHMESAGVTPWNNYWSQVIRCWSLSSGFLKTKQDVVFRGSDCMTLKGFETD